MGHTKVISECKGKSKVISPYETQCINIVVTQCYNQLNKHAQTI